MKASPIASLLLLALLSASPAALWAQWAELPATGSQPEHLQDRTTLAGQSGQGPLLTATLLDQHRNARQRRALVQVETDGVVMTDPAGVNHVPKLGQAHIQYRLDHGDIIASTSRTFEFRGLSPGDHTVQVMLAGNDGKPLGEPKTLTFTVP